jgi:shikimate kinase
MEVATTCQAFQQPAILALGGGAWESETIRDAALESGYAVLWIAEHPGRVWDRVARDPGRPLAQERRAFLERWRVRMKRWSEGSVVLPLGRNANLLAEELTACAGTP